jgi:HK97 family phage prohead protease
MRHLFVNFEHMEQKVLSDEGDFEGYAAIFGNLDLGGDVIEHGAFEEFQTNKNGDVVVLLAHDRGGMFGGAALPIGSAKVFQDDRGLRFKGKLVMDDPLARRVHAHMKAGTLEGMSIGYDILPGGQELLESGVRKLTALKLWEISPVIWGMNPQARIEDVKGARDIKTIRDFEKFLRDVGGFSNSQAKGLALHGFNGLEKNRDDSDTDTLGKIYAILDCADRASKT